MTHLKPSTDTAPSFRALPDTVVTPAPTDTSRMGRGSERLVTHTPPWLVAIFALVQIGLGLVTVYTGRAVLTITQHTPSSGPASVDSPIVVAA